MGVMQNLLEAKAAGDGAFALKEGVELVHYSKKTAHLFDSLPAIGEAETREAAPALISGDTVLKRGTIWVSS